MKMIGRDEYIDDHLRECEVNVYGDDDYRQGGAVEEPHCFGETGKARLKNRIVCWM